MTKYYHVMVEKKCVALIAYPSTLDTAVNFWMKKFPLNQSCIRSIISTSETLTTETREKLASYFGQDCGIYARYSNTENGILGQETGTEGTYLLNWASYYFEILKLDSDEPVEEGELGRRMDLIYDTKNEVVSPFLLCRTMRLSKGIEQCQFIQKMETEDVMKITVTKDGEKPKCEKEIVGFQQVLGSKANITVEYVGGYPVMN